MGGESWTIERIDDEWADLRQGDYLYCVPLSQLPDDVEEGDRLRAPNSSASGASRWVADGQKTRKSA